MLPLWRNCVYIRPTHAHRQLSRYRCRRLSTLPPQPHGGSSRAFQRRFANIRPSDLNGDNDVFSSHERVLNSQMLHFTSFENKRLIEHSGVLRPASDFSSVYDGALNTSHSQTTTESSSNKSLSPKPPACFFTLQPQSDGVFFPFSFYPQSAEGLSPTACLSVSMDMLLSDDFTAFYSNTTVAPYRAAVRMHSQVVFVAGDEHLQFAHANFIPISKTANPVLRFCDGVPEIATRISSRVFQSDGITSGASSDDPNGANSLPHENSSFPHTVAVVVLGELQLANCAHKWLDTHRLLSARGGEKIVANGRAHSSKSAHELSAGVLESSMNSNRLTRSSRSASTVEVPPSRDVPSGTISIPSSPSEESIRPQHLSTSENAREDRRLVARGKSSQVSLYDEETLEKLSSLHNAPNSATSSNQTPGDESGVDSAVRRRQPLYVMCPVCHTWRDSMHDLKSHYRAAHTDHRLQCPHPECDYTARYRFQVVEHTRVHHTDSTETLFYCHLCHNFSPTPYARSLTHHLRTVHADEFETLHCEHSSITGCSYTTIVPAQMDRHVSKKHNRPHHACQSCSFVTHNPNLLARHHRFAHEGGVMPCPEDGCDYKSKYRSNTRHHVRRVHKEQGSERVSALLAKI